MGKISDKKLAEPLKREQLIKSTNECITKCKEIALSVVDETDYKHEQLEWCRNKAANVDIGLKADFIINMFIEVIQMERQLTGVNTTNTQLETELEQLKLENQELQAKLTKSSANQIKDINDIRWLGGKRSRLKTPLIVKVLEHKMGDKKVSVVEFCKQNRITREMYYNIVNVNYKNEHDRTRVQQIKDKLEKGETIDE